MLGQKGNSFLARLPPQIQRTGLITANDIVLSTTGWLWGSRKTFASYLDCLLIIAETRKAASTQRNGHQGERCVIRTHTVCTHWCLSETTLSSRGRPRNFWPHGQISIRSEAVFQEACIIPASSVGYADDDIPPAKRRRGGSRVIILFRC